MIQLEKQNKFLVVLDHHKTAQANCEGLDFCTFDMNRSGAGITWDYFHNGRPRPKLVDYMEDRDLWRFALPKSKEIFAYVASYPKDLETWDRLDNDLEHDFGGCCQEGAAILRYHDQKAAEMAQFSTTQELGGYDVPVVNCPYNFASDVVHLLTERFPDAPFAASYFYRADGTKQYSVRGRDDNDFDVSAIAKIYGGGGHKKAAGFEIEPNGTPRMSRNVPIATKGPQ
jgi:oligoribonuclease NrnB/cAMP/cGMP phosphodiesterase (DHH superfamily)